jgi:hypothetical protein
VIVAKRVARGGLTLVGWLACALPYPALGAVVGPIDGSVREQPSGAPVAGALVIARWTGSTIHGQVCDWLEVATTGADGGYRIPFSMRGTGESPLAARSVRFVAYKRGYAQLPDRGADAGRAQLKVVRADSSADARLAQLRALDRDVTCLGTPIGQAATLLPLYRQLFDEAMALPPSTQADSLRIGICKSLYTLTRQRYAGSWAAQRAFPPGADPEEAPNLSHVEPRCLPIVAPSLPTVLQVTRPPPGAQQGAAPPASAPPH